MDTQNYFCTGTLPHRSPIAYRTNTTFLSRKDKNRKYSSSQITFTYNNHLNTYLAALLKVDEVDSVDLSRPSRLRTSIHQCLLQTPTAQKNVHNQSINTWYRDFRNSNDALESGRSRAQAFLHKRITLISWSWIESNLDWRKNGVVLQRQWRIRRSSQSKKTHKRRDEMV